MRIISKHATFTLRRQNYENGTYRLEATTHARGTHRAIMATLYVDRSNRKLMIGNGDTVTVEKIPDFAAALVALAQYATSHPVL